MGPSHTSIKNSPRCFSILQLPIGLQRYISYLDAIFHIMIMTSGLPTTHEASCTHSAGGPLGQFIQILNNFIFNVTNFLEVCPLHIQQQTQITINCLLLFTVLMSNFIYNFDTLFTSPPTISQWQGIRITCRSILTGLSRISVIGVLWGPLRSSICIKSFISICVSTENNLDHSSSTVSIASCSVISTGESSIFHQQWSTSSSQHKMKISHYCLGYTRSHDRLQHNIITMGSITALTNAILQGCWGSRSCLYNLLFNQFQDDLY